MWYLGLPVLGIHDGSLSPGLRTIPPPSKLRCIGLLNPLVVLGLVIASGSDHKLCVCWKFPLQWLLDLTECSATLLGRASDISTPRGLFAIEIYRCPLYRWSLRRPHLFWQSVLPCPYVLRPPGWEVKYGIPSVRPLCLTAGGPSNINGAVESSRNGTAEGPLLKNEHPHSRQRRVTCPCAFGGAGDNETPTPPGREPARSRWACRIPPT